MGVCKRIAVGGIATLCLTAAAHAETGIYAGLGVGQARSDVSNDLDNLFDTKDTAFKIFGGYRILDWVGVEAGYVDLGEITGKRNTGSVGRFRLEEAGFDVFGVLYWNVVPLVDLFAKGGFIVSQAHVRTSSFFGVFDDTDNSTDLAFGVGGQVHFGNLAFRAEYERFDIDTGGTFDKPDMISVGATYTFF